jgi:hypothetical protein
MSKEFSRNGAVPTVDGAKASLELFTEEYSRIFTHPRKLKAELEDLHKGNKSVSSLEASRLEAPAAAGPAVVRAVVRGADDHGTSMLCSCLADELSKLQKQGWLESATGQPSDWMERKLFCKGVPSDKRQAARADGRRAWFCNILTSSSKPLGFKSLFADGHAGAHDKPLVRLLRYAAQWYYHWIMGPTGGASSKTIDTSSSLPMGSPGFCEPLFQLLTPHQQLWLIAEVVLGLACRQEAG